MPRPTRPTATRAACRTARTRRSRAAPLRRQQVVRRPDRAVYAVTYGLPVAITRCGNFYGGGDLNWNRIVPGTIRSVLEGERPVIRSDGTLVRDYFYVEDGAAAYVADSPSGWPDRGVRGRGVQLLERDRSDACSRSSSSILALMGTSISSRRSVARRPHEIRPSTWTRRRRGSVLGWEPRVRARRGPAADHRLVPASVGAAMTC